MAENSHAYAKALHYKEIEFRTSPAAAIAALISINNRLQHPEAAIGILRYAQITQDIELKESWYEKLGRWEDALSVYERKQQEDPTNPAFTVIALLTSRPVESVAWMPLVSGNASTAWHGKSGEVLTP